jgi:hypothetical protein
MSDSFSGGGGREKLRGLFSSGLAGGAFRDFCACRGIKRLQQR